MPGKFEILTSLAELAKAGYKPSDVKDILESLKTDPDLKPNGGSDLKEKTPEDQKKKEDDPKKDPEPDPIEEIINRNLKEN